MLIGEMVLPPPGNKMNWVQRRWMGCASLTGDLERALVWIFWMGHPLLPSFRGLDPIPSPLFGLAVAELGKPQRRSIGGTGSNLRVDPFSLHSVGRSVLARGHGRHFAELKNACIWKDVEIFSTKFFKKGSNREDKNHLWWYGVGEKENNPRRGLGLQGPRHSQPFCHLVFSEKQQTWKKLCCYNS